MLKAVFWDFGGVITSSPFESFNKFEIKKRLPENFLRTVNSTNPDENAWAKLERSEVDLNEFDKLFLEESSALGHAVPGKEVIALLKGEVRPQMIDVLELIKNKMIQACLTNNIQAMEKEFEGNVSASGKHNEVMQLFDFVIESSKENVRKPDPRFYLLACKRAQIKPEEAIFLDDLGINLKPARALGMKTIKVIDPDVALEELQSFLTFKIT
jgi:putative hydrolase of the HAD superfamily|tara:strand:- start:1118 stop:1756 length:639 start_codon:yes stop_codon:yes gene_type:complete